MTKQPTMPPMVFRSFVAALLVLGAALAGSCEKPGGGTTNVTVIGDPPKIVDPAMRPLTAPESVLLGNVAQGLVRFDAAGQIVPGLAERWNVTDDGLSYIFRLQTAHWPDGRRITAQRVTRLLRRQISARSANPLRDTLGAIDQITAMTDRVIEISLKAPRPNLLALLAQPELGVIYDGQGSGPFRLSPDAKGPNLGLARTVSDLDEEQSREEKVLLAAAPAPAAVDSFLQGKTDLVLGGTFIDLPIVLARKLPRNSLQFDPAIGLFGLVPARSDGPLTDPAMRRLLSQAIDRQALVQALNVPGLLPRATVLEPGLDGVPNPVAPEWATLPMDQKRTALAAASAEQFGSLERPVLKIALPEGPGSTILLQRLEADWSILGIKVAAAKSGDSADLRLIDLVAPSTSAAWYLREFRCGQKSICDPELDKLLDGAREATIPAQRYSLLSQAARLIDEQQLFIPITAPIRWLLVSSRVQGIAVNRFARHTLTGLGERPDPASIR